MDESPIFQANSTPNLDSGSTNGLPPLMPPPIVSQQSVQNSVQNQVPPPPEEGSIMESFKSNFLKILVGVLVLVFLLFLVFGIIIPNFSKNKNEKVTLTYWGLWEDGRIMQSAISKFERENPNIKINYSKQDPRDYRERLMTRIDNGSGPDVFRFHNTWYPMLSGVLLPLPDNVISKQDFQKNYYLVAQSDLIKNGAIYGIPLAIDTLALYINTDIFKSAGIDAPKNWEEFRNDAKSLTVKDSSGVIKTAGAALGTFSNIDHAPDILSLLFVQNGANVLNLSQYTQQVSDALKFYTSFSIDSSSVWDSSLDPSLLNFSKGNLAMVFGYSWDYFNIKALNPSLKFSVVPVPQLDSKNPSGIASYWVEGASVKSKHQKETAAFLHFLAQKETQQLIYSEEAKTRAFGEPYSNVSLAEYLRTDLNVAPFVGQANFSVSSYFVDKTNDGDGLNTKLNTYLGKAVDSVINSTSPESATATLFQGYEQVLKEYGN
jgi:multiple sugar transport system substrate-binding protein